MAEDAIKVFISYSWDSKEHKDKVYHLAQALRDDGIDCTIDQFVQSPDNWDRWMLDQIDESDFVLIVCTERYYRRYRGKEEVNKGLGVTWESTLIIGRLHDSQGRNPKFYPIFFDTPNLSIIPDGIRTSYFDLSGYDLFNLDKNEQRLKEGGGYQDLYRLLTKQPHVTPRKIGSLKKLETVDRETEQQEAKAAERRRQQELGRQHYTKLPDLLADPKLKSEKGVDYTELRDLLAAGKWKEADQETDRVMCLAAGRTNIYEKRWLEFEGEEMDDFPCEDLRTINYLWLHYSNGKFGFSVQKDIYESLGGTTHYNQEVWEKFGEVVGWCVKGNWLYYNDLTFPYKAPRGHLPIFCFCRFGYAGLDASLGDDLSRFRWGSVQSRGDSLFRSDLWGLGLGFVVALVVAENCDLYSSEKGIDYTQLRDLLAAGKWKEADRETDRVMCLAAGREKEEWMRSEDIDNFPCEDLRTINHLWLHYSNGKFGFSVQKEIFEQSLVGARDYDQEVLEKFSEVVGWRKGGNWLFYSDLTFSLNAPPGHLPALGGRSMSLLGTHIFGGKSPESWLYLEGKNENKWSVCITVSRISNLILRLLACGI